MRKSLIVNTAAAPVNLNLSNTFSPLPLTISQTVLFVNSFNLTTNQKFGLTSVSNLISRYAGALNKNGKKLFFLCEKKSQHLTSLVTKHNCVFLQLWGKPVKPVHSLSLKSSNSSWRALLHFISKAHWRFWLFKCFFWKNWLMAFMWNDRLSFSNQNLIIVSSNNQNYSSRLKL